MPSPSSSLPSSVVVAALTIVVLAATALAGSPVYTASNSTIDPTCFNLLQSGNVQVLDQLCGLTLTQCSQQCGPMGTLRSYCIPSTLAWDCACKNTSIAVQVHLFAVQTAECQGEQEICFQNCNPTYLNLTGLGPAGLPSPSLLPSPAALPVANTSAPSATTSPSPPTLTLCQLSCNTSYACGTANASEERSWQVNTNVSFFGRRLCWGGGGQIVTNTTWWSNSTGIAFSSSPPSRGSSMGLWGLLAIPLLLVSLGFWS
ncbi:uncharacterized protein BJ171DRAFT_477200 [Polychytrium aggregatum]|uniref:uncharacterized protein n=1 Tax=Polychytrium aggregatum TaxID=110093 RepID=UPI0022FE5B65|nr:uncharacterized protein BJ171DRAFT_477200 [Polychytrium aggregatum]KAI9201889.1 hypothetical protein BJ171DRAFT_477200 [Polychytrium aggregatum]